MKIAQQRLICWTMALLVVLSGTEVGQGGICTIEEPDEQEVQECVGDFQLSAQAPVTCDSEYQGLATGSAFVPHITGEYTPGSWDVLLHYDCDHDGCTHPLDEYRIVNIFYVETCLSASCIACGSEADLGSMRYRIYLGRSANGKSAGFLELYTNGVPNASLATPDALKLVGLRGVDCVRDSATGQIRQIMAAESFGTVTPVDGYAYNIAFYRPGSVAPDLDTNGWYVLKPGAVPFVDYQIRNPDTTNAFERLQLVQTRDGTAKTEEFSWATDAQGRLNWGLSEGNDLKRIGLCVEPIGGNETAKTWTTRTRDGAVASVQQKRYISLGGELRLTQKIEDPDGAALRTQVAYVTNAALASYGAIAQTINPDGSWVTNVFNADGVIREKRSGWLDAGPGASAGASTVTAYDYTPFLEQVESNVVDTVISTNEQSVVVTNFIFNVETNFWPDTGATDGGTPRVETVTAADVPVSKTLRVIYPDTMGYKTVEEVRLLDPSRTDHAAAYADPANPRTLTQYMPKSDTYSWSERPEYTCHPDGRTESYAYVYGNYAAGEAGAPGVFTESPVTGACMQVTCTHGTTNAPGGVAYQTTREVTIETGVGRVLQSETWLCAGETNFTRVAWRKNTLNDFGQIVATCDSAGSETETTWSCCGPESETAADGTVTETAYDALKRPVLVTREGEGAQPDLFTETAYDAAGRVTFRRTFSGDLSQSTTNTYDLAGRLTWSRGPDGVETLYSYTSNSTTTVRGGLTNLSVRFADGRAHYTEQNGLRQQTHAYGLDASSPGCQTTTLYTGPDGAESPVWTKTVTDPLGRTIAQIRPGYGGALLVTSNFYDTANNLVRAKRWTSGVECRLLEVQLFAYDSLGNPLLTCQDLDLDGQIDLAGPDRVTGQATRYVQLSGDWYEESASWTYPGSGSSAPLTNAIARTRLTGLGGAYSADGATGLLTAESVSIDARGNQTVSRTVTDRANKTVYQITDTPDSTVAALTVTVNGLLQSGRSTHDLATTYAYDALGRQVAVQDARGAVQSRGHDVAGRVAWESDPATNGTWYAYDALGRRVAVTNALGQVTHTAYDAEGRTIATWGATYPVAYEYDAHGRMTAMATTRDNAADFAALAAELAEGASLASLASPMSLDLTTWLYEEATGLLTNKVYADGKGTAYTYTSDGQLASRIWARGVTTTYAYTNGNMIAINYSDSTPDVAFTYDRLGRMVSAIVAGISTNAYTYDSETLALSVETQNGMEINRTTDALGRDTGFSLGTGYSVQYGYDAYGRFHSVSSSVSLASLAVQYSRLNNSDLISGMTASSGFLWTRAYEVGRSLITSVENRFGETVISRYDYANDQLGRRTSRADSGLAFANPAFDAYSYNGRSEVTGAQRYHGTDVSDTSTVFGGRQFGYAYDPIGNRTSASETIGGETLAKAYTANALNQYTAIANPGAVGLRGDATNTAVVTVNSEAVQSDGITSDTIPWHFALEADNGSGPDFPFAEIVAVINPPGTNTPDIVSTTGGHVYAPPQNETLTYDNDGNLTSDGRWQYTWNGENRLIKAEEQASPTNRQPYTVEYAYDHQGRMVWKQISTNAVVVATRTLLWDGYNIIRETIAHQQSTTNHYVWGLDLSGSLQGAGGVGGLLAEIQDFVPYFAASDANGNVTEYLSDEGAIAAHYEYSPFGEIVVQSGDLATTFTHRFSTKPWCAITELSEYEFRKYSPSLGRWLNRDPIQERGGIHVFLFVDNDVLNSFDFLGQAQWVEKLPLWFRKLLIQAQLMVQCYCENGKLQTQITHKVTDKAAITKVVTGNGACIFLSLTLIFQPSSCNAGSETWPEFGCTNCCWQFSVGYVEETNNCKCCCPKKEQ